MGADKSTIDKPKNPHPLDSAEVALKQAARSYTRWDESQRAINGSGVEFDAGRDQSWERLKRAARDYGALWDGLLGENR